MSITISLLTFLIQAVVNFDLSVPQWQVASPATRSASHSLMLTFNLIDSGLLSVQDHLFVLVQGRLHLQELALNP